MALRFQRALRSSVLYGIEARKAQKIIRDTVRSCSSSSSLVWVDWMVLPSLHGLLWPLQSLPTYAYVTLLLLEAAASARTRG